MNQKLGGILFALAIGLGVAIYAYQRVTDPLPGIQRQQEERIVLLARDILRQEIAPDSELTVVDPLAPNRIAGKVYIYPVTDGWQVSGYYRRGDAKFWHPWLMTLDENGGLLALSVRDAEPSLLQRSATSTTLTVDPT